MASTIDDLLVNDRPRLPTERRIKRDQLGLVFAEDLANSPSGAVGKPQLAAARPNDADFFDHRRLQVALEGAKPQEVVDQCPLGCRRVDQARRIGG